MELGGLHPISGRQGPLTDEPSNAIWPDACIVVPFSSQVKDDTGTVVNPVPGTSLQGGWTVTGTLEELVLTDLVQDTTVAGVTAVWAAGPNGDTPALHVLGDNPFAWLTSHLDAAAGASTTRYGERDQWFGTGPAQQFSAARRFGELVIEPRPLQPARLLFSPAPWLPTRLLQAPAARLSFSYPSSLPIVIDELWLGVLLSGREKPTGDGWTLDGIVPLPGGWRYALLRIAVGAGTDGIRIPYGGAIAWIRYRHRALEVTTPQRITLAPGHYELTLSGKTTGTAPPGFTDAAEVPWSATQRFWVDPPASLRPYVHSSTIGDDRLFGTTPGFDPTLRGVGFPAHRDYLPVVRFCVPYVSAMFPELHLTHSYLNAPSVAEDAPVVPNPAGASTLPAVAIDWQTAHGGSVGPDDEVVMRSVLTPGAGALDISFVLGAGAPLTLDSWATQVSRFANAAQHLGWPGACLTRLYRSDGPHDHAACPTLAEAQRPHARGHGLRGALRANDRHEFELEALRAHEHVVADEPLMGRLLQPLPWHVDPMPDEYTTAPPDWPLASALASLVGPVDTDAAQRFLLFLWRSGVHLVADAQAPALANVGDPVATTSVEAVCDDVDRPFALWLRTPEPIDWRRLHGDITVRHVAPDDGCPQCYANRRPLALLTDVLPSPDGSSALLISRLGGTPVRLPRGEVTVALRYEPAQPGLVELRPRIALSGGHEAISLTFLQPFGQTWPLPPHRGGSGIFHLPRMPDLVAQLPPVGPADPGSLAEVLRILQQEEVEDDE